MFRVVVVVVVLVCVYRTTFWVDWAERERERDRIARSASNGKR